MKSKHLIMGLLLQQAIASAGSIECRFLMECMGGSAKACELRFKAAERISRKGTGAKLLASQNK